MFKVCYTKQENKSSEAYELQTDTDKVFFPQCKFPYNIISEWKEIFLDITFHLKK